ncbi:MAG TPA: hypothetical protein QF353_01885 [Gammaproteobacteria bacterium]|nr:hypothetical protein [Gammaproteobacteria bacterium]
MNRLTGFSGRVGRLGFALVYIPIFVINMIGCYAFTDYFSWMSFEICLSTLVQFLILMASVSICLVEKPNSRWFNYLGFLVLGLSGFLVLGKSRILFLLHPVVSPLVFMVFYSALFITFCSGYVRRLHDLGWRVSPAAKAVFVAYVLLYSPGLFRLLVVLTSPSIAYLCVSTMYVISMLISFLLVTIFCVSLPFVFFKSGTLGTNSFGDEPQDLLGV